MASPFFSPPETSTADSLAILHLKRDSLVSVTLKTTADDGYAEGAVTNTRFGSFPHSTLIGLEWGSQVRASKVDTGSRGRKGKNAPRPTLPTTTTDDTPDIDLPDAPSPSRKRRPSPPSPSQSPRKKPKPSSSPSSPLPLPSKPATEASSGFLHILPPTPETWTSSLDHRTQVVYTPDSSYILQQLRVRPGDSLIEAGAGSGSFTHAAARAVYDGGDASSKGRVYSFEYHGPRVERLRSEIAGHGLGATVRLARRDVCAEGFSIGDGDGEGAGGEGWEGGGDVTAVFLDLPAPWLALPHLRRGVAGSPLSRDAQVHLCSFSPCIEQVAATTGWLRRSGWTGVRVVEVAQRRVDVRRERVGYREEGLRGVQASAADVGEAVARLREVEKKFRESKNPEREEGGELDVCTEILNVEQLGFVVAR